LSLLGALMRLQIIALHRSCSRVVTLKDGHRAKSRRLK